MTLPTTTSAVTYAGNGVTTQFDWTFPIPSGALAVYRTENDVAVLVDPSAYSASGLGDPNGGTVSFATAPALGQTITIKRNVGLTQDVALVTGSAFYAEVVEGAFDRATMQIQQLAEEMGRAVQVPIGSGLDPADYLDAAARSAAAAAGAASSAAGSATASGEAQSGSEAARDEAVAAKNAVDAALAGLGQATETIAGISRQATLEESTSGTSTTPEAKPHVTPEGLAAALAAQVLPGTTGAARGLVISTTGLSASVSVAADEVVLSNSAGRHRTYSAVSVSASVAVSGAGGLDTGSSAVSTWYAVWLIGKTDGTIAALLSLSATAPTIPSGYDYSARVGWIRTDGTANHYPLSMKQTGRSAAWVPLTGANLTAHPVIASGTQGNISTPTFASASCATVCPPTAVAVDVQAVSGEASAAMAGASSAHTSYAGSNPPDVSTGNAATGQYLTARGTIRFGASQTIYVAASSASSSINCVGWEDA